ncbi:hypothetical protein AB4Y90_14380, partial [Chryseobacterium sp. 2TAF14]|uniref:hypothetical protein n=1 Tax=Chryseobacterium sp. 2TAF14 TaxID=3233007 RepID=UPI003F907DBC
MMKNILILLGLVFSTAAFSQEYTSKIAKATCECFAKAKADKPNLKNRETQLGLCMIKSVQPYAKEVKRDFNIDVINEQTSEAGEIIAKWLLEECPDIFVEMVNVDDDSTSENDKPELIINGTVSKIEKENFIIFHVVGENKMLNKLYWISSVDSNLDLPK